MHGRHLTYAVAGLALAFVPAAAAQNNSPNKPKDAAITLAADPTTIVYSGATTLSGRVSGASTGGVTVRLEADTTRPYGDSYKPTGATATTDASGKYTFALKPLVNTQYRAIAQASPPVTSAPKLVLVRMLVGIKLSDSTPARGRLVTFSGSVYPAHDGRSALIQKRSSTGRFVTVARTTLRDAGDARSTYSRRVRVRDGVYRVKVSGDGDHINGFSRARTINVAG
ncbi:MAG: hypothetical protein AVDCRST_MAG67-1923 [uncultured Solirubrobacteraceae bacterium]|uniref:Uncharacterized protein n=1 Tax=uncultured Solirubrobacteraceae bacterium TaxID=1162706 RepID=A0A6J4SPZ4_9ACTN|nr:MAG: hypothetical protein AVDCRST_MAG67-1923 [uncultured Solirubrobacteraceae bacterium]